MGNRRKSREIAMQALYMLETVDTPVNELVKLNWVEEDIENDILEFAKEIISGTCGKTAEIDKIIIGFSKNWKFERIASIDKAILRIALYEMIYMDKIPYAITINEAIELGKTFGGENSGQFINGILDSYKNSISS
ncbi:MAG: transcription antitermination factor NusB [Spirochaetes bacterium]|nr:transcription antitermination factor NusB [Spirochaetota bacterium]